MGIVSTMAVQLSACEVFLEFVPWFDSVLPVITLSDTEILKVKK